MTPISTTQIRKKNSIPPTVHVIVRKTPDDYIELIIDVAGAFERKDTLKKHDFQFVQDRSAGICSEAPLDKNGNRKRTPVWRRIIAAVPSDANAERTTKMLSEATSKIKTLSNGVLAGARIKGAKTAALKLVDQWIDVPGVAEFSQFLSTMETPWEPNIQRSADQSQAAA